MPSKIPRNNEPEIDKKIIQAAMHLASGKPWTQLSLGEIARAANVSTADLFRHFSTRDAILKAAMQEVDLAMLKGSADFSEPVKDRLFEVLMLRFDALLPYRPAMMQMAKRLRRGKPDAVLMGLYVARHLPKSMRWALEAAGLTSSDPKARFQAHIVGLAFLAALRVWLDDDSGHLAKTMASLNLALKRITPFLGEKQVSRPIGKDAGTVPS